AAALSDPAFAASPESARGGPTAPPGPASAPVRALAPRPPPDRVSRRRADPAFGASLERARGGQLQQRPVGRRGRGMRPSIRAGAIAQRLARENATYNATETPAPVALRVSRARKRDG